MATGTNQLTLRNQHVEIDFLPEMGLNPKVKNTPHPVIKPPLQALCACTSTSALFIMEPRNFGMLENIVCFYKKIL